MPAPVALPERDSRRADQDARQRRDEPPADDHRGAPRGRGASIAGLSPH
jgi:hypothetical protein